MNLASVNPSLTGMRALVTAGASGIGLAIADALIAGGARVHICDVSDDFLAEFRKTRPEAGVSRADVASETDVKRLFVEVEKSLGGLDVLVNNAGIAGPTGGVDEIAPADWRRTIDVCLTGQFLCAHFGVPMLKAAGGGTTCLRPPVGSAMRFVRLIPPPNGASSA